MKPTELVDFAQRLLQVKELDDPGAVERASALLGRQAIEECAGAILSQYGMNHEVVDFTSQLLCLQGVMANKDLARETAAVWGTLSGVVHHEGLELSPTETEVVELIRRTAAVVCELQAKARAGSP
jgi:hypothetical protein